MTGPMKRPKGANADEWAAFLEEHKGATAFLAVQIVEAIEEQAASSNLEIAGWQYKRPTHEREALPGASEWIYSLYPTREAAERADYGGYEGRALNQVRPLYTERLEEK